MTWFKGWTRDDKIGFIIGLTTGAIGWMVLDITLQIIKWRRRKQGRCVNCGAKL